MKSETPTQQTTDTLMASAMGIGVPIVVSSVLIDGVFALTRRGRVVWDSKFGGDSPHPSEWDGMMVSNGDFERLKATTTNG